MIPSPFNRLLAGDIEANNLLTKVSKLWCIVSIDIRTKELFIFHDYPEYDNAIVHDDYDDKDYIIPVRTGTFEEGVEFWHQVCLNGGKLIVHNGLGYDKKVIEKFYPWFITDRSAWIDTLELSKMQMYERPIPKGAKGAHGLQAWGCRFGIFKPEVKDWTFMDAFKLHRCIEDVRIQERTFKYLNEERIMLRDKLKIDMSEAYPIDFDYAEHSAIQEMNGALIDIPWYESCIEDLDQKIRHMEETIEPQLPKTLIRPPKLSNKEITQKLAPEKADQVKDRMVERKRNGEIVKTPFKFFSAPTRIFKTKKQKCVSAFHLSHGFTDEFRTVKELREFIKEKYPETVFKYPDKKGTSDWMVNQDEKEFTLVDKNLAEYFGVKETDINYFGDVGWLTKISFEDTKLTQQDKVKAFLVQLGWKPDDWNWKKDSNKQLMKAQEDTVFVYPPKKVNGHQVRKLLKKGDLIPTSPKLTEESYETLPEGLGKDIADYNTYQHRRRFIKNPDDPNKGLLNNVDERGRIPAGLNVFATATGRSSQSVWVNSPGKKSLYGAEIRRGIIAPDNHLLVGSDMKSAQLSIAAYYAKNWEYFNSIINGEEFKVDEHGAKILHPETGKPWYIGESGHCVSARAFGVITDEDWRRAVETQDQQLIEMLDIKRSYSKAASFGTIFGCSGKKLAGMLGIPESEGQSKKDAYLKRIGLENVIKYLTRFAKDHPRWGGGYIPLPMGYWVWCGQPHKYFNYLDQGTEAVCQKLSVNHFNAWLEKETKAGNIEAMKILDVHDEFLTEAHEDCAQEVGEMMCASYKFASDRVFEWHHDHKDLFPNDGVPDFAFNLDGGFDVGHNYLDCH